MNKIKGVGRKTGFIGAVISVAALITFCIYGVMFDYFDVGVVIFLILGALCGIAYSLCEGKWTYMLNLVGVLFVGIAFGVFFLNSYYVWADRLNNIEMYGSRGTLHPVVAIMILCVLAMLAYIISCFSRKEETA